MVTRSLRVPMRVLAAIVLVLGSSNAGKCGVGHGGGAGHSLGGYRGGWCGGLRPGYRGYYRYGYPGWYGLGLGLGLGYGLGYGMGYGYPYPYYGYGPGYPVYVDPGCEPLPGPYLPATPVAAQGAAPPASGNPTATPGVRLTDTDVLLNIRVPADAVVKINGVQTTQTGPRREFMSSGLSPGRTYTFTVAARWMAPNGQAVDLEQRVSVQGGERRNVDFLMQSYPPPNELPTALRAQP